MSHVIVTLDGPAGVGKSTIAKMLADELGIPYLDTGAMFRAAAYLLGDGSWQLPGGQLQEKLSMLTFSLHGSGADSWLEVDGKRLGDEIRTEEVGMWASNVAVVPAVRAYLKMAQVFIGNDSSLVAEGRDMGTVVFPAASHKFFLDADAEERARRRFRQLQDMGESPDLVELTEQIAKRDHQDRNRTVAPLKPADDAVVVDTTTLTREQVFERIMESIRGRG